jgi:hypothetical protein
MRKCALSVVLANAMLAVVSLPNQAGAMTVGILTATPTELEQAGWCSARRGCLGRP